MAEDWIKARADLYRDPKVCRIAEILMSPDGALTRHVMINTGNDMNVTRDVMRYVTVGALVTLWGVTRLQGQRNGNDLVLRYATLKTLDDMANFPGIGDAMSLVGWAIETSEGVTLPRFFEDNNAEPVASKGTGAERQKRYRDRLKASSSDVTSDVTVTSRDAPREEKRREDKPHNAFALPEWVPSDAWKDFEQMRTKRRKPLTDRARSIAVGKLDDLRQSGNDVRAVIEQTVLHSWDTFYELKQPSRLNGHSDNSPFA